MRSSSLRSWCRLLRLPNLVTVPGDPMAGYLLAAGAAAVPGAQVAWAMAVALLLYAAGLILNDVADARADAVERPDRPLPSGAVDEGVARVVAGTLVALALVLARHLGWRQVAVAIALVVCIVLYNLVFKRTVLGPLSMGLCRGLSLLLGASLVPGWPVPVLGAAAGLVLYVAAVTLVARREMAGRMPPAWAAAPAAAVLANVAILVRLAAVDPAQHGRLGVVLFLAFALAGLGAWRIHAGGPRAAPGAVGLWIGALPVLQAAYCIASGAGTLALAAAFALLLAWPAHRLLSRVAPAS